MSTDPFANTTTVKNILQHVLSPKIVNDGLGGYVTKTDLVNIDVVNARNVVASSTVTASNIVGGNVSVGINLTVGGTIDGDMARSGIATVLNTNTFVLVPDAQVGNNSVIFATSKNIAYSVLSVDISISPPGFNIYLSGAAAGDVDVNWFIAKY
jgi:hypothetical protein